MTKTNLNGPTRKIDGKTYKIIYRSTKQGCIDLLGKIGPIKLRERDKNFGMYANYFLMNVNE